MGAPYRAYLTFIDSDGRAAHTGSDGFGSSRPRRSRRQAATPTTSV